jgi:hypothetical protein
VNGLDFTNYYLAIKDGIDGNVKNAVGAEKLLFPIKIYCKCMVDKKMPKCTLKFS